ncbi:unnamed protein product [Owenia fusiformis]|uniref:Uncharacterized protein n=1 Tax=Owenia fusiformis TaxID=6347 RepID=A0A8J1U6F4_OWEFU|nr:unnamed protein product [Owenia fusiformis]
MMLLYPVALLLLVQGAVAQTRCQCAAMVEDDYLNLSPVLELMGDADNGPSCDNQALNDCEDACILEGAFGTHPALNISGLINYKNATWTRGAAYCDMINDDGNIVITDPPGQFVEVFSRIEGCVGADFWWVTLPEVQGDDELCCNGATWNENCV